jgi:hypothetical protein
VSISKFAAIAVTGLSLAACAGSPDGFGPGPKENSGTLLGAGGGALLGAAVAGGGTRSFRQSQVDAAVRLCAKVFGDDYASLLGKAAEVAAAPERRAMRA